MKFGGLGCRMIVEGITIQLSEGIAIRSGWLFFCLCDMRTDCENDTPPDCLISGYTTNS